MDPSGWGAAASVAVAEDIARRTAVVVEDIARRTAAGVAVD
jgi:hypothetical protein